MSRSSVLLSAFMLAVFVGMTGIALSYPPDSQLLPLVVGIPGTLLCAGQLLLELRHHGRERPSGARFEGGLPAKREAAVLGWLAAFVIGTLMFGFLLGGPALVFAYLYWGQSERPVVAGAAALGLVLLLHLAFQRVLGLKLFQGLILERLTG